MTKNLIAVILIIVEKGEAMKEKLEKIEQQHLKNYYSAIKDTIQDNTDILVQEDLIPLFKEPPLASMDMLKGKILEKAKEHKIILSTTELDNTINAFRKAMLEELEYIGNVRKQEFQKSIDEMIFKENPLIIEQLHTTIEAVRKDVKGLFETKIEHHIQEDLIPNIPNIIDFTKSHHLSQNDLFLEATSDYLTYRYPDGLIDVITAKVALKDQILLNRLNEHESRYKFTKEHSRLLQKEVSIPNTKNDKRP